MHNCARHARAAAWAHICTHGACRWKCFWPGQLQIHRARTHRQLSWVPSQSAARNAMRDRQQAGRVAFVGYVRLGTGLL